MARTKNYGFCRNEMMAFRLSWNDKEHLEVLQKNLHLSKSEVVRMLINLAYLNLGGGMDANV